MARDLIMLCDRLIARLVGSPPRPPEARLRASWHRRVAVPSAFREGIHAIDWTMEERGLAGLADLAGLSWRLDMDLFFEAWVETIATWVAPRVGATVRSGRLEQTRVPLDWSTPTSGSQRSLLPDVVLEGPDVVVVLDSKYKQHADDIQRLGWHGVSDNVREQHRNDLLQALAYSTLFEAPRVVTLLVYPCAEDSWWRLHERGRVLSRARARTSPRNIELGLLAVPLGGEIADVGGVLEGVVREAVGSPN
ncbi:MAG: hypothetical protein H0X64_15420 [Gemmatimonadaceae bacterium]|nr:hypothetical protein [Gemmatimonadaceae bacterium]